MQPPSRGESEILDPGLAIAGIATPPPPNLWRLISLYDPDALMIGVLITAVALYIRGVVILSRRGDKWPVGRTVAFALGITFIDYATSGGLGVYAKFSFEYHMMAHMLLGMIAPIGLVLGAPITLALRTLPQSRDGKERGVRALALTALHSKYSVILTNPIAALALFAVLNLSNSRSGRTWRAVRDNEVSAALAGINIGRTKVIAFVCASALAGLAGAIYGFRGLVAPSVYPTDLSLTLLTAAVIGGLRSIGGAIFGTFVIVFLPDLIERLTKNLAIPETISNYLPALLIGTLLLLTVILNPKGSAGALEHIRHRRKH
jgi:ABC-type branched-subunit amino acid transport system permease subunit